MSVYSATLADEVPSYLSAGDTVASWALTTDHKRIAVMYLVTVAIMFGTGVIAAAIIYAGLLFAHNGWLTSDGYQRLISAHGVAMVFGVLVACSLTVFGQFLVPLMIGAERLAFPRLGLTSWYLFTSGCLVLLFAALTGGIGPDWLILSPQMSLLASLLRSPVTLGVGLILLSLWAVGVNIVVSVHRMRAVGMGWFRLPLFIWAQYSMGMVLVCGIPIGIVCLLLTAGTAAVSPQRLFLASFYPIVLASLLPPAGTVSEVITCFSRRRIHGYRLHVLLMLAVPVFALLGWGRYLFPEGGLQVFFSLANMLIASILGILVVLWTATMLRGKITLNAPMLFAIGCVWMFGMGSLMALLFSASWHLRQTLVETAYFHYLLSGAGMFGFLAGLHFWWPKITGRMYPQRLAKAVACLLFVGFHMVFLPLLIAGVLGVPARFYGHPANLYGLYVVSSIGCAVFGVGCFLVLWYLLWSFRHGDVADSNPWGAVGLEWSVASPPPPQNFDEPPQVTAEPYSYQDA